MEKKISIKTLYLIAIISLGLIGLGIGSTYAMFTASAEISNPISLSSNLNYNSDILETVTLSIEPKTTKTATLNITNNTSNTLNYITWYSATNDRHLKIGITEDSSSVSGTLVAAGSASVIVEVRNAGTTTFTINIGISSSSGSVVLDNSMKTVPNKPLPKILTKYITDLYTNSTKTIVTNNSIEYNYATSVSLMNDRLGGTTSDYNAGNIRYYGASPNNYIDIGDVYTKDTTINNWDLFGLSYNSTDDCYADVSYCEADDYGGYSSANECFYEEYGLNISSSEELCGVTTYAQGTPILYRIIGLFKDVELADGTKQDLIKVVREESIGVYSWDTSDITVNNGYGINEWSQADLMKLLNPGYESEAVGGSLYWNSGSGTCYNGRNNATTSCDFTVKGLKNDATRNMIEEVTWNLGGWNISSVYSNQIYSYERGTNVVVPGTTCSGTYCNDTVTRTTSWTGKVALMYPSDYGYATDFTKCSQNLFNYDNSTDSYACRTNDWLYNGGFQWLLTPSSGDAGIAWAVHPSGTVYNDYSVYGAYVVRPVLYLKSELTIESGDGSSSNPYRLSVS